MLSTQTREQPVEVPKTDDRHLAHLVAPEVGGLGRDGVTLALEARVHGLPLLTLCRRVLVPSRDARTLPLCRTCRAIFTRRMGEQALDQVPYS